MNLPFRYSANDNNGNQRFISILFKAIQDGPDNGGVTVFNAVDDRFTTPMTVGEVADKVSGGAVEVPVYDEPRTRNRPYRTIRSLNFYIIKSN